MFFSGLFQRKSDAPVTTPAELADAIGLSYDTYTGKQISSQRAMRLTAVFSCVRVLAESVGMLPCNLYHLNGSLKQRATGERLHKLISTHPNGYMTPQEFWELVVTCLCLRGNFYAYKVKAFGEVAELLPVDPGCVVPKLNSSWEPIYQVTFPDGSTDVLSQEDIWHVRTLTLDGLVGLNPIAYAREAISLAAATEENGARLFSNGAVTSGVLRTEQTLSDQAYERLKKDFEERHTGLGNAHRPMILEMGLDWKSMALNAEDSQFLETRKFQLEEICRLFRVPLHMVQNTDRATFNNIEELGLGFINYSLVPYLTRIEQRINTGLVRKSKQGVYYAKFNAGALLRGDMKSRFEAYATGINWGIYSPNDCRDLEDMNPRPGGDVYLTPMNMTEMNDTSGRWSYARQLYGHVYTAKIGTLSELVTAGDQFNQQHITLAGYEKETQTPADELAASRTARAAVFIRNDPARPTQTGELVGMLPAPKGKRFTMTEQQTLLSHGVATAYVESGVLRIQRDVTTYRKNAYGVADNSYLDSETLHTSAYVLRKLKSVITSKYGRHKLASDGTRFGPGQAIVTPAVIKGELLATYRQLERAGIVENYELFKQYLVVERDASDPNRLNTLFPPDYVNQLRVFAVVNQFRLQYSEESA